MKQFFRNYFSFNQVELKGIRLLLILIVALMMVYLIMPVLFSGSPAVDASEYRKQVDSFLASATYDTLNYRDHEPQEYGSNTYRSFKKKDHAPKHNGGFVMQPFDPNGLPPETWVAMGLSEKQAAVIKNYEAKGGKFRTKADVKKQFVISEEFYTKIEPFIVLEATEQEPPVSILAPRVDINQAGKDELMLLKGVKDYLAEGIVKYRNRLGGFTSVDQLKEVKYLSERIFTDVQAQCFLSTSSIRKLTLNIAEWKELAAHPYIGGELATQIINYRKQHGIFKDAEDFKKSGLVDGPLYAKLVPYLSFSH